MLNPNRDENEEKIVMLEMEVKELVKKVHMRDSTHVHGDKTIMLDGRMW